MDQRLSNRELSPEQWVSEYLRVHGFEYDYKCDTYKQSGIAVDLDLLHSKLKLAALQHGQLHLKPFLWDALAVLKKQHGKEFLEKFRLAFSFQSSQIDHVAKFVRACTGQEDPCDVAVFRHWLWQVRRKLFGLPVEHHMMIVLFGRSGGGKSIAVHKLLKPIEALMSARDFSIFNDQFSRRQFIRNYVMFFDEMAKAASADVNLLKNLITAPSIDYRQMFSEALQSGPQNCTFIACTNNQVNEQIKDPTSSRRYYQINCSDQLNWNAVNQEIDFAALWRSVDETASAPMESILTEVKARQEVQRYRDCVEEWVEDFRYRTEPKVRAFDAYEDYKIFMLGRNRGREIVSLTRFGSRLSELGFPKTRDSSGIFYTFEPVEADVA